MTRKCQTKHLEPDSFVSQFILISHTFKMNPFESQADEDKMDIKEEKMDVPEEKSTQQLNASEDLELQSPSK